jgi:hypothetical protein
VRPHQFLIDRRRFLQLAAASTAGAAVSRWSPFAQIGFPPLRLGIVGLGTRGMFHAREAVHAGSASVIALCDRDGAVLCKTASRFRQTVLFRDIEALLAQRELCDALVIALPEPMELALVKIASQSGIPVYFHPAGALSPSFTSDHGGVVQVHIPSRGDKSVSALVAQQRLRAESPQKIRVSLSAGPGLDRRLYSALDAALRAAPASDRWASVRIAPFLHPYGCDYRILIRGADVNCSLAISITPDNSSPHLKVRGTAHEFHVGLPETEDRASTANLWRNFHAAAMFRKQRLLVASPQTSGVTAFVLALMAESRARGSIEMFMSEAPETVTLKMKTPALL